MLETGLRHLIVSSGGRCVGMLDDRALFALWPMGPLAMRRNHVSTTMRSSVSCALPDTDLAVLAHIMMLAGTDAVPVVDADGYVLGIVTGSDIASVVARHGVSVRSRGPAMCG
jgi:CBS-domain-containing membrane protein